MQLNLRIYLIIFSLILFAMTIRILQKGRMSEKYSLIWFTFALLILLVGLVPGFLTAISNFIGFEVLSNFVIGVLLVLLTIITILLTVMIDGQKKKATLLIQEVSILKKELEDKK